MGMNYKGDFAEDAVVTIFFDTFDKDGASVSPSGFTVSDIEVFKDDDLSQRATTDGITIDEDHDGSIGIHMIRLDTNNNTGDAGFWVAQADYLVVVNAITIDTETVRFIAGTFSIENRVTDVKRIRGDVVPQPAITGVPDVNPTHWRDGAIPGQNITGVPEVDVTHQVGGLVPVPAATGIPDVNTVLWIDEAIPATNTTGVPLIDLVRIVGGLVPTPTTTGILDVNVERWLDTLVTLSAGAPDVNIQSTDNIALSTQQKADVNFEALDVVSVDTIAELSQGVPATTPTVYTALMLIYMALRNRLDVDTSGAPDHKEIYNDANVVITKKVLTDDGSTYREDKMITGP
jgi:hypothetical protein